MEIFLIRSGGAVLILFASLLATFGQDLNQLHTRIRAALDQNDSAAITTLREVRQENPNGFTANNCDYLFARLLERTGETAASAASYQSVLARHSIMSQYALWHLAQIARASGDLVLEREHLRRLLTTAPTTLLYEAATMRLAESFFESADYQNVVSTLRGLSESKKVPLARQALALSGSAAQRAGDRLAARAFFTTLTTKLPDPSRPDDFALVATGGLDALDHIDGAKLSESDHLLRAAIYQFNRDFEHARFHYLALMEDNPQSSAIPESLYQLGRGLYQEEKYDEALKYLLRVAGSYPTSGSARDALGLVAGTYARQKRTDDAVAAYQQLIERFPNAPNPERPYLNIIDVLRDAGRDDSALAWVKRTRERFKDQIGSTLALFAQAKIHIAQNAWRAAVGELEELRQFEDLGGARIPGGTTTSEVAFLRALALEQSGRIQEAIDAYLSLPEGRNEYYGFRANDRLRGLSENESSRPLVSGTANTLRAQVKQRVESGELEAARRTAQTALRIVFEPLARAELVNLIRRSYSSSSAYRFPSFNLVQLGRTGVPTVIPAGAEALPSHQALADELLFLGLSDEGTPELVAARAERTPGNGTATNNSGPATDMDYTLAVLSLRGGMPYPAVRFAEQVWRAIPGDYLLDLAPRQVLEMLYPVPYRTALLKQAEPRQLDPRFVLSIARQETRFQAEAKSVAAARGLMQFIAATASDTAKQLGRGDFHQDDLYNPNTAIEFGSQYLASLFQRFPDQPQAVAASYNGGADNVARWIARSHSHDADRYVPEIGFSQSKDYVLKVLSNFWVYQKLYNGDLQPQR